MINGVIMLSINQLDHLVPSPFPLPVSALTEKIVAVLPRMRCPHRLEPHQIQGLDFIHIFPVIQWLVKLAIATKEEMGDYIRAFSESQFSKEHKTSEVSSFTYSTLCYS